MTNASASEAFPDELKTLEKKAGMQFATLRTSSKEAVGLIDDFRKGLEKEIGKIEGIDVLLTGSIARREVTRDSDCDYLIVSNSAPEHDLVSNIFRAVNKLMIELELNAPGSQGVFGDFVSGSELYYKIGLDRDSNINTTRRFSVLLESSSVLCHSVREVTIRKIIERYCAPYSPKYRKPEDAIKVPRFLTNDLIRYWRTIAVDFEAKRWRDLYEDWGLRYAKLLTLRKVMFAASFGSFLLVGKRIETIDDPEKRHMALIDNLCHLTDISPLARLASTADLVGAETLEAIISVISDYDEILALLGARGTRMKLKTSSSGDSTPSRLQELAEKVQTNLEIIFFEDDLLRGLTRRYSLF